ncbi:hypothetical protein [Streptomyces hiroshimensis]|uniref:Uncharacterized protein n=1 Tax=Streptomyces hiroshimensis TaxID=66424 RepID=A0ABQ2Z8K5_9ACTN|nr:hypothetical protein [Streptomyces hiroshimensis]GGY08450.1 hypothetical protein GCM10010324_64120 [Streptomyces hiroshimensis]
MKDSISRLLARTRALFSRRAAPETPVAPPPKVPPKALPAPRTPEPLRPEPLRPHCGVYVWATAHGIDLRPTSPLGACTCAGKPHAATDADALRAKVREVNYRSTWGK